MPHDPNYELTKHLLSIISRLHIGLSSAMPEDAPKLMRLRKKFKERDDFLGRSLKRRLQIEGLTIVTGRRT